MQKFSRPLVFENFCIIKKKQSGGRVTNEIRKFGYFNFKIAKLYKPLNIPRCQSDLCCADLKARFEVWSENFRVVVKVDYSSAYADE